MSFVLEKGQERGENGWKIIEVLNSIKKKIPKYGLFYGIEM